ncbi:inactive protein RESTRICTED TEV MOVEMENT 2-like [Salvia miltiorrhiza]|uniref:inactive protein RESTRICTED TEV MOVEMENT 2-like n=1 Tax=Salvia miltiorrhiza TaxID=226208 RepID=UPI0025AC1F69|nr:inactive protein RESTRICTED TEV MOVEMENT 2-like [Salvia miltiorrhiza]
MERERKNPRNMKFEYVLPSSWWTETADSHCLLIDVPGFKKEEVRIRADAHDHVIVSGERQANDNTILHFEQAYKVPEGCNIEETNAILEDETYYVIIPKKHVDNSILTSVQQDSTTSDGVVDTANNDDSNQNHEETPKGERPDSSFLQRLSRMIKTKRCLVLTTLLAFSLGVFVSQRYQSTPQKERKKRAADDE